MFTSPSREPTTPRVKTVIIDDDSSMADISNIPSNNQANNHSNHSNGQSIDCNLNISQLLQSPDILLSVNQFDQSKVCSSCGQPIGRHSQSTNQPGGQPINQSNKVINDPIHGLIDLHPTLVKLIDTTVFQRLRDLSQLGTAYFVFPGASHRRFEHSIGVCHVVGALIDHLTINQPELLITSREKLLCQIAGLCHDLGHGPFSHAFDSEFIPAARKAQQERMMRHNSQTNDQSMNQSISPSINPLDVHQIPSDWTHEEASIMMLSALFVEAQVDITESEMQFLKEMIDPKKYLKRTRSNNQPNNQMKPFTDKLFLYEIVSNMRTSFDVDKFDYLLRDSYNLGMNSTANASNNFHRLLRNCRVIDNEICWNSKQVYDLYEIFHTRYSLFKQVYSHRVTKAIEYMIVDVLQLADPILHISSSIHSPERYLHCTDHILRLIEGSSDERLAPAQELMKRIRRRDLYVLAEEAVLPVECTNLPDITPVMLLQHMQSMQWNEQSNNQSNNQSINQSIDPNEIIIQNLRLNYAAGERNPLDTMRFFHKSRPNEAFTIPKSKISHLMPQIFQERIIRVYLKDTERDDSNKPKLSALRECTMNWFKTLSTTPINISRTPSGVLMPAFKRQKVTDQSSNNQSNNQSINQSPNSDHLHPLNESPMKNGSPLPHKQRAIKPALENC